MPYTRHGHPYGVIDTSQPKPTAVARCGGLGLCKVCREEAGGDAGMEAVEQPSPAGQAVNVGTLPIYLRIGNTEEAEVATVDVPITLTGKPDAGHALGVSADFDQAEFWSRVAGALRGVADELERTGART
ncbi:hypothetical protein [Sphaerimonospora mesophila]|uniref:hypothetical protein n=1 Tax=Sphaerimonospora mesophila TaxID=37483 RepID=UPI0006E3C5A7